MGKVSFQSLHTCQRIKCCCCCSDGCGQKVFFLDFWLQTKCSDSAGSQMSSQSEGSDLLQRPEATFNKDMFLNSKSHRAAIVESVRAKNVVQHPLWMFAIWSKNCSNHKKTGKHYSTKQPHHSFLLLRALIVWGTLLIIYDSNVCLTEWN